MPPTRVEDVIGLHTQVRGPGETELRSQRADEGGSGVYTTRMQSPLGTSSHKEG